MFPRAREPPVRTVVNRLIRLAVLDHPVPFVPVNLFFKSLSFLY